MRRLAVAGLAAGLALAAGGGLAHVRVGGSSTVGACDAGFTLGKVGCEWQQSAANAASLDWSGLVGSSYDLRCDNIAPQTANAQLQLQFNNGSWVVTGYTVSASGYSSAAAAVTLASTTAIGVTLTAADSNISTNATGAFMANLSNMRSAAGASRRVLFQTSYYTNTGSNLITLNGTGTLGSVPAVVGVRLNYSTGNITQATCSLTQVR